MVCYCGRGKADGKGEGKESDCAFSHRNSSSRRWSNWFIKSRFRVDCPGNNIRAVLPQQSTSDSNCSSTFSYTRLDHQSLLHISRYSGPFAYTFRSGGADRYVAAHRWKTKTSH